MSEINFDDYADNYNQLLHEQLSFFAKDKFFSEYKIKIVRRYIQNLPNHILDFGCGIGRNLQSLRSFFPKATIAGCDIAPKALQYASKENP